MFRGQFGYCPLKPDPARRFIFLYLYRGESRGPRTTIAVLERRDLTEKNRDATEKNPDMAE
jgi:hypothetical protein